MEDVDELANSQWFRILIIVALLSGVGGGATSLIKDTSDRYHAGTAERDFEIRDTRIKYALEEIKDLKHVVQRIDETHPPPDLIKRLEHLEARMWAIELENARTGP